MKIIFSCYIVRHDYFMLTIHQKGKGYQEIKAIDEAFKYENTRSDFKCCSFREKSKTVCHTTAIRIYQGPNGHFQIK